jgi:Cu/Ag efflux pump CusA
MMKTRTIVILAALALMAYSMTSCITTETITEHPDGTTTTTKVTAPAPGYDAAAVVLAGGLAGKIVDDK